MIIIIVLLLLLQHQASCSWNYIAHDAEAANINSNNNNNSKQAADDGTLLSIDWLADWLNSEPTQQTTPPSAPSLCACCAEVSVAEVGKSRHKSQVGASLAAAWTVQC